MELYNTNPQFKNYLLLGLLKDSVAKMSGMVNTRYAYNVVNSYSMLVATSSKEFDDVSKNFIGPCLKYMQKVNKKFIK